MATARELDVLVIGAGVSGLTSAICLAEAGISVRILAAEPPQQTTSDITDERMLLAVSTKQSTLYDQIRYSGNPSSFAWVLPIHGTVDVGLSADVLFGSFDALTAAFSAACAKRGSKGSGMRPQ